MLVRRECKLNPVQFVYLYVLRAEDNLADTSKTIYSSVPYMSSKKSVLGKAPK